MLFSDLRRLEPAVDGQYIPKNILRKLKLPMPKQVFQQLVVEHALTRFTQDCFGHLDLHAIRWDEVELPAATITTASYEDGSDNVDNAEAQTAQVPADGWKPITILSRSAKH